MPGYRKISSELKAKAALEALKDEEAISTIASKYRIDPKTLRDWVKKKYREAGFQWENEPHGW